MHPMRCVTVLKDNELTPDEGTTHFHGSYQTLNGFDMDGRQPKCIC